MAEQLRTSVESCAACQCCEEICNVSFPPLQNCGSAADCHRVSTNVVEHATCHKIHNAEEVLA